MAEPQTGADDEWLSPGAALNRLDLDQTEPQHGAGAEQAPGEHEQRRHAVTIGPYGILLPADEVSELVRGPTIYPIPKTADWVKGLLNLRGNLVPVFDLTRHFDATAQAPESPQILAVGRAEQAVALIVDGVPKLASIEQPISHTTLPLPEGIRNHVRGAFMEQENMWLEIDLSGLIESLTEQMQE